MAINGSVDFKIDKLKNTVTITFDGFFNGETAAEFMENYENAKKSVVLSKATLNIDARLLKPFPQNALDQAVAIYQDYLCFSKINMIEADNVIAKSQLHRVLKGANIEDRYNFVTSF